MKKKRFISLLLTIAMCLSLMPITVMAADPPVAVPNQYLSNISITRTSASDPNQVYLRSDSLNDELTYDEFIFDPMVAVYDIMLVDAAVTYDAIIYFVATLKNDQATDLYSRITKEDGSYITATGYQYTAGSTSAPLTRAGLSALKMSTAAPLTVKHETGVLESGVINQATGGYHLKIPIPSISIAKLL